MTMDAIAKMVGDAVSAAVAPSRAGCDDRNCRRSAPIRHSRRRAKRSRSPCGRRALDPPGPDITPDILTPESSTL